MPKHFTTLLLLLWSLGAWGAETRTLTDMAGRTIELPAEVKRVVTVGGTPALNSFVFALGKAETIGNGVTGKLKRMPFWHHQQWFLPGLFEQPQVSGNPPDWTPRFERLAMVPFDVALVNNAVAAEALTRRGYTAAVINWHGPDSIIRSMRFLGDLFGVPERAQAYAEFYRRSLAKAAPRENKARKPTALYLRLGTMSLPMVTTANTIIKAAGGRPVAAEVDHEHANIDLEQLLAWDPDVLFVWGAREVKKAYHDPKFAALTAVRERRVYSVPMGAHFWTHYTPEQPLCVLWMAERLDPQHYTGPDPRAEAAAFYRRFMGISLSEAQLNDIFEPAY